MSDFLKGLLASPDNVRISRGDLELLTEYLQGEIRDAILSETWARQMTRSGISKRSGSSTWACTGSRTRGAGIICNPSAISIMGGMSLLATATRTKFWETSTRSSRSSRARKKR